MTRADARATPLRVLVADDDPIVRLLVVAVLAELGHDTEVANDGADAWRMFEEWHPDLVVLDVDMPHVDGIEVCRRIRELDDKREVFVLFLTGRDHPETLEAVLDAGGDEFIVKPTTPEDLRARLIVARRRITQDAARRRAEDELSKARWLSGIGEATLALQHEINNPLSALLGNAELMIMELEDKGERNELLDVIHEQALRIAEVVRRLRRLKNPESVDYVGGSRMINLWKETVA
ncbi:MAG: response regulator receiver sensor signal transduction histidine kinase [Gemmatimonadetes bacterium]|nr:response regulator receiver sensor signal transduction histidine kinase [Gemmatimonadota bacterium]